MQLNKQLAILAEEAEEYGIPSTVMEQGVIPILKAFAQRLTSLSYYIMKDPQGDLLISHLAHREKKGLEKAVLYAFLKAKDGEKFYEQTPLLIAHPIPVTHLLFQVFAIESIDSLIVIDNGHNLLKGTEIQRQEIHTAILKQLQQLKSTYKA